MSVLQSQDSINAPDLQVWNNAAFDDEFADESMVVNDSWCNLKQPIFFNRSETFESDTGKENQSPGFSKSPVSVKSPIPIKPLHSNSATENSQGKPLKLLFKQGLLLPSPTISETGNEAACSDSKIDSEIKDIEMEISRLNSKLEALRLEKAAQNLKTTEKRGRIVPAKFMEQKQSSKITALPKKIQELPAATATAKFPRRSVSLGPSEIFSSARSMQKGKPEITPIRSIQNRRKSCFLKLPEIEEDEMGKQRRSSMSLNSKSQQSVSKIQAFKQGFTTVGSKKSAKREDGVMSRIQPKKLFKEGEKLEAPIKQTKNTKVVSSRYNQIPVQSAGTQKNTDRRKSLMPEKSHGFHLEPRLIQVNKNQVTKKGESSAEVMDHKSLVDEPSSILKMADLLPKIRTIRGTQDSPRDSGAAKRVAELIGRKSYFGAEEEDKEVETSVCQALSFDDEEEEEEE